MALENKVFSAPINIVRYNNGTMLKLASGTHEFISYNYDAEKKQGRFEPDTITITATLKGDLVIAGWKYSTDGITWKDAVSGKNGITIGERTLTVAATSDLFADTNSSITFMCSATAGGYYDTLTITRTIDPIVMFQKTYTAIEQTKDTIRLIASDEELQRFQESSMYEQLDGRITVNSNNITSTVSAVTTVQGAVNQVDNRVTTLEQTSDSITANVTTLTNKVDNTLASDVLWYWACDKATGVQVNTPGAKWTTEPASLDAKLTQTNKYLWMYHEYTYNDTARTKRNSTPGIIGVYGETGGTGPQGRSVVSITEKYARNNNSSSAPASWGDNVLTPTESERFVWNYEIIQYSDGTDNTDPHVIAVYGQTGRGIVSITEKYAKNNNANTAPQSGWGITVLTPEANNRYVWNREDIVYSDSPTPVPTTAHIVAVYAAPGAPGAQGVGISKVEPLYYATDTDQEPDPPRIQIDETRPLYGTWTLGIPSIDNDHPYMYMCDQITYDTDPATYAWSAVVKDNATVTFQERLSYAETQITPEAIISTVRSEYGEVSKVGINLLLDTNAPTVHTKVDAKDNRTLTTRHGQAGWGDVLSNAPDGIKYGLEMSGTGFSDTTLTWYRHSSTAQEYLHLKPGNKYVIKYYVGNLYCSNIGFGFNYNDILTSFRLYGPSKNMVISGNQINKRTINSDWEERYAVFVAPSDSGYYYDYSTGAICADFITSLGHYGSSYYYRYRMCGYMVCDGEIAVPWNDGVNYQLSTNSSVGSQIMQTADAIRMKAGTIAWEADNSSMSEDGTLEVESAVIKGSFSGVTKNVGSGSGLRGTRGLVLGRGQIVSVEDGVSNFSITMPYNAQVPTTDVIVVNADDEVISEAEPVVPEMEIYSGDDISGETDYYTGDAVTISTGNRNLLVLGTDGKRILTITSDGSLVIDIPDYQHVYMNGYRTYSGYWEGQRVINGLIMRDDL